jgi:hypothetical protein
MKIRKPVPRPDTWIQVWVEIFLYHDRLRTAAHESIFGGPGDYGPENSGNRPVWARMPGGVWAGGEDPSATRLSSMLLSDP